VYHENLVFLIRIGEPTSSMTRVATRVFERNGVETVQENRVLFSASGRIATRSNQMERI
jgi:hypothetical protein